jgi:hypothetical protein
MRDKAPALRLPEKMRRRKNTCDGVQQIKTISFGTGCIPLAVSSDQSNVIKQTSMDFDHYEFTRRAYRECLLHGISEACEKINLALSKVP